ncbi:FAD-dependent oxidoreductase [Streptomyces sp. NBC_00356]|uniref:FAD-dependent oxidoreductase n=1 Tax=Streptomyces sp. NBC_00356 TaxID=2975724 RepID=UPI002E262734
MNHQPTPLVTPDVLVIGAGPAGLTAAAELARHGAGHVLVVDREAEAGGIPATATTPATACATCAASSPAPRTPVTGSRTRPGPERRSGHAAW